MRLYKLRNNKGVTQKELAEALKVTVRTITNYENGSREPDIATLVELASYFSVSVDYLIGNDSEEPPEEKELLLPLREKFSKNLVSTRQQAGVTSRQLADALGVTEDEVRSLENGEVTPSFEIVRDVADFFKKSRSFDFFIGFPESYEERQPVAEEVVLNNPVLEVFEREKKYLKELASSDYRGGNIEVYQAIRGLVEYDRFRTGNEFRKDAAALLGASIDILLTDDTDGDKRRRFERVVAVVKEMATRNK